MTSSLVLLHVDAVQKGIIDRDKKSEPATVQDSLGCEYVFFISISVSPVVRGR
jgi:hypothetical protein